LTKEQQKQRRGSERPPLSRWTSEAGVRDRS
jgi:hypothetical protein